MGIWIEISGLPPQETTTNTAINDPQTEWVPGTPMAIAWRKNTYCFVLG
jgi:hypothetical protein